MQAGVAVARATQEEMLAGIWAVAGWVRDTRAGRTVGGQEAEEMAEVGMGVA